MKLLSPFSEPTNTASAAPPCPRSLASNAASHGVNFTTPTDPTWAHFLYAVSTLLRSTTVFRQTGSYGGMLGGGES